MQQFATFLPLFILIDITFDGIAVHRRATIFALEFDRQIKTHDWGIAAAIGK
jgi:hypothetical protein